jgi:zinc transporter, ZIP family
VVKFGPMGLLGGSALLLGAAVGYFANVKQRTISAIMAFGSGVLISAPAFDLMDKSIKRGGFDATTIGFISGAVVYTAANWYLAHHGARHRKRSGKQQPSEADDPGGGAGDRNRRAARRHPGIYRHWRQHDCRRGA